MEPTDDTESALPVFDAEDPVGEFFNGVVEVFYGAQGEPQAVLRGIALLLNQRNPPPRMLGLSAERQAEAMVDAAWQDADGGAATAVDALRLWPLCPAAFSFLGVFAAEYPALSLPLHTIAVLSGYTALGQQMFEEHAGEFWHLPETRPFMDALGYLATAHMDAGSLEAAAAHFGEMLSLNPADEQGARFPLLAIALQGGNHEAVQHLLEIYPDEPGAAFAYGRVLHLLQRRGDVDETRLALRAARAVNHHVPDFLTGTRAAPEEFPETNEPGGEAEALLYCDLMGPAWEATEGAVTWLRTQSPVAAPKAPEKAKRSGPREV